ncbi:MAG: glycosyltransferase [Candidatus Limnocylindria bacterium]
MDIVLITNSLAVGGVETNLLGLADSFHRRGHSVRVVSAGGALRPELDARGISHVTLPIRLAPGALAASALSLRRSLERGPAHIVHAMSAAGNLASLARPRGVRPAYVSSPMGLAQSDREPSWKTDLRNRLLVAAVDRVLVISDEIARSLERIGVPPRKMTRCPVVGLDIDRFDAAEADGERIRRELGIPPAAPVVTTIGALHPRKRHDLFLAAAALVRRAVGHAHFIVVGEGYERDALRHRAEQLGLAGAVRFAGQRRDVRAILAATDVYVKPGIVEGFVGITVLEAMAARVPVVAFDTHDVRAAIVDGETGLIGPRGHPAALGGLIVRLLNDRGGARALAEAGRLQVERRFALSVVASELERIYTAVADEAAR